MQGQRVVAAGQLDGDEREAVEPTELPRHRAPHPIELGAAHPMRARTAGNRRTRGWTSYQR